MLTQIPKVEWGCNTLGFFFGVGWVRVTTTKNKSVVMKGVLRPAAFAELIEQRMKLSHN